RFVGKVFEDRPDYYGSADLYLCPTHIASFGVTLLEAMACGTPMVVADNHGYRSVVDGGAEALIVSKDDPKIWAESAIALLGDPARRAAAADGRGSPRPPAPRRARPARSPRPRAGRSAPRG